MIPLKAQEWLKQWSPRFSPGAFKAGLVAVVAAAFVIPLVFVAIPYLEILNDMAVQPKGKAQDHYGSLSGEKLIVERDPPAGTIPMGYYPYHLEGKEEEVAKVAEATLENPVTPTMETLELGRKLFDYYCFTCHGTMGEGDGAIVGPDLFPAPPSLHTDQAQKFKDGRIFHVITRGQNTMPSYADKFTRDERWAIIHYVRALQRAMNPGGNAGDAGDAGESGGGDEK
jgi:mono/diheme cytochrome c family protein